MWEMVFLQACVYVCFGASGLRVTQSLCDNGIMGWFGLNPGPLDRNSTGLAIVYGTTLR